MDKLFLGETYGSWLMWAVGLVVVWVTIKNYLNENRIKLVFLINDFINYSVKSSSPNVRKIHNDSGVTIKVINSGKKTTKVKYLGIGKIRSKFYILLNRFFRKLFNKYAYTRIFKNPFEVKIYKHTINHYTDELAGRDPYKLIHPLEDTVEYKFDINGLVVGIEDLKKIKKRMTKNKFIKWSFYFQSFDGKLYQKKMVLYKKQRLYKDIKNILLKDVE